MRDREIECFLHDVVRSLSLTRLSRSSPGLIPPLVTLAAQREGREPTGRTRSESGREVSDRHAERRGGRRECKTEPHVVPLSLRFGSLRPHPHRARLSYLGASPGGPPLTRRGFAPERKV